MVRWACLSTSRLHMKVIDSSSTEYQSLPTRDYSPALVLLSLISWCLRFCSRWIMIMADAFHVQSELSSYVLLLCVPSPDPPLVFWPFYNLLVTYLTCKTTSMLWRCVTCWSEEIHGVRGAGPKCNTYKMRAHGTGTAYHFHSADQFFCGSHSFLTFLLCTSWTL